MNERQMEDLIAQFPDDFFRGQGLTLKGRQQSFAEVGRFDLLFTDSFQTNVLMELKAVAARYEDATQLARYKDALQQRGVDNILMWLVAPQISNSVREFLDRVGIEYSEIHEAQFRRVAGRHGIKLEDQEAAETHTGAVLDHPSRSRSSDAPRQRPMLRRDSPYALKADFDKGQLDQLLRSFESVVRRQIDRSISQKLRHELLNSTPPTITRPHFNSLRSGARPTTLYMGTE